MKDLTKKKEINSKAALDFILTSMPSVTPEMFFYKFKVSPELTLVFLAKKSAVKLAEDVTFLN